MVQVQSDLVDSYIMATGAMSKCIRLFFEYPTSSALHCAVSNLCEAVLRGPSQEMIHDLLVTSSLCERLARAALNVVDMPPGSRPVNTGFVIDLSLAIHDVEIACPSVGEWLQVNHLWEEHTGPNGTLSRLVGEQQGPTIGGPLPKAQEEDDWLNEDPARREEELIRVLNSFGTTPPPQELVDALERTQQERMMLEMQTMEMQTEMEARARELMELQQMEMQQEMEQQGMVGMHGEHLQPQGYTLVDQYGCPMAPMDHMQGMYMQQGMPQMQGQPMEMQGMAMQMMGMGMPDYHNMQPPMQQGSGEVFYM